MNFRILLLISTSAALCGGVMNAWCQAVKTLQQELDELEARFLTESHEKVTTARDARSRALMKNYGAALDREVANAQKAGDLDTIVAIEAERKRLASGGNVPAEDEPNISAALRRNRQIFRDEASKIEVESDELRSKMTAGYLAGLKRREVELTKLGKFDDAKAVRLRIEAGLVQKAPAAPPAAAAVTMPQAQPEKAYLNSLGMTFAPVQGASVLFCIHETRAKDYAAFSAAGEKVDDSWRKPFVSGDGLDLNDDHPVVNVSWFDATEFCKWLSRKDGRTHRLPTDREWSIAAGLGDAEPAGATPAELGVMNPDRFAWGDQWPPPNQFENFADASTKASFPSLTVIEGFQDGYPATAPVMSFKPNAGGIHDMAGNVFEWVFDTLGPADSRTVLRGGAWNKAEKKRLHLSSRSGLEPSVRVNNCGFRVVVELSKSK